MESSGSSQVGATVPPGTTGSVRLGGPAAGPDVRWEGMSHDEIYAKVHTGPGSGGSSAAQASWASLEGIIREIDRDLAAGIAQVGAQWQGRAADRMAAALTPVGRWLLDTVDHTGTVLAALATQAEQAGNVRTAMPPVPYAGATPSTLWTVPGGMATSWDQVEVQRADARAEAVALMNGYSRSTADNEQRMASWAPPPAATAEGAGTGAAHTGIGTSGIATGGSAAADAAVPAGAGAAAGGGIGVAPAGQLAGPQPVAPPPIPDLPTPTPGAQAAATGGAGPVVVPALAHPPGPMPRPGATQHGATPAALPHLRPAGPTRPPWSALPPVHPGERQGTRTGAGPGGLGRGPHGEPAPRGEPPRGARTPPPPLPAEPTPRSAGGSRPGASPTPGMFPPMVGAAGQGERTRARPSYLVEDADVFVDDRWFTPQVIGADQQGTDRG